MMKNTESITIQTIQAHWLAQQNITLDVLRLDELHPVVSGNKWFKLQYYLQDALVKGYKTIGTFGGAYSNHIVATAFTCKEAGLNCIGIIRGEKPRILSHTLLQAQAYKMQLHFVSREEYRNKEAVSARFVDVYWINEGGYGNLGAAGAEDIIKTNDNRETYSHFVCAVGTGTTVAGLVRSALPQQTVIGISSLKNNVSITDEVNCLLPEKDKQKLFVVIHNYHFGGYAKYNIELLNFMNEVWKKHQLPLDFVYTAKAFYGVQDMIINGQIIPRGSRVLFIHTGGLQGNLSIRQGILSF